MTQLTEAEIEAGIQDYKRAYTNTDKVTTAELREAVTTKWFNDSGCNVFVTEADAAEITPEFVKEHDLTTDYIGFSGGDDGWIGVYPVDGLPAFAQCKTVEDAAAIADAIWRANTPKANRPTITLEDWVETVRDVVTNAHWHSFNGTCSICSFKKAIAENTHGEWTIRKSIPTTAKGWNILQRAWKLGGYIYQDDGGVPKTRRMTFVFFTREAAEAFFDGKNAITK
jgi:hypothetical protein